MNKQTPTHKRIKTLTVSLFLFLGLVAADTLWAKISIMPLGDSITLGILDQGILDPNLPNLDGYRRDLWLDLNSSGYDVDFVGQLENGTFTEKQHEGDPGATVSDIASIVSGVYSRLDANPADVILLHIGTNSISPAGLYQDPSEVAAILDEIDVWENDNNRTITVILAEIINRNCITDNPSCQESAETTAFNNNVAAMVQTRIGLGDRLLIVDMENSAGIDYRLSPVGDMIDDLHPLDTGYTKMATKWFADGLLLVLPLADAGPDQSKTEGENVQLDGTSSNVPIIPNASYQVLWEQTAGTPMVTISDPNSLTPTFTAPDVGPSGIILRFRLSISDVDNANITDTDFVDVTVNDTPVGATVTVNDVSATEGTDLSFTVTLDNAVASGFNVSVNFTNGTATGGAAPLAAPEDYADDTVTLNFAGTAGETQTFTVATLDDALDEGNETFTVSLVASNANVVDTDTAVGTIIDNDTNVINTVSNGAGGGGGGCFIQTVSGLFN